MGIMIMSVKDIIISMIEDIEDPTIAWRMLKSLYEPQNSARKFMLNHKLYLKMGECINQRLHQRH